MNATGFHHVIAIVGGSGAGKTRLANRICRVLGGDKAGRLALDDFYRDQSHLPLACRAQLNFDDPDAIDWSDAVRVLRACRAGLPTPVPRYDFATHTRPPGARVWSPRPVTIVEGLWLLHPPELRAYFDLAIYLDAPVPLRHARRIARDTAERGYAAEAVRHRLATTVMPMHERFVEPQKRRADLVLAQPFRETDVEQLADRLWALFHPRGLLPGWIHDTFRAELLALLVDHEYFG